MTTPNTPANGGQILTYHERIDADPDFIGVRSKEHMFDYLLAEVVDLRASLAAPAIPTVDRNSVLEGWKLVPIKPTLEMVHAMRYSTKSAPPFGVKRDPDKHELHHFGTGLAEAAYCRALAASPAVAQPAAQVAVSEDQRDAARWRALVGSARIKPQGSAGLEAPRPNNYAYMGLEIWSVYDRDYPASMLESMDHDTALGAKWLTKYADIAIEEQRATPATVKTAEGE